MGPNQWGLIQKLPQAWFLAKWRKKCHIIYNDLEKLQNLSFQLKIIRIFLSHSSKKMIQTRLKSQIIPRTKTISSMKIQMRFLTVFHSPKNLTKICKVRSFFSAKVPKDTKKAVLRSKFQPRRKNRRLKTSRGSVNDLCL